MPAGIIVLGDHGYRQIDDTYKNFAVRSQWQYSNYGYYQTTPAYSGSPMSPLYFYLIDFVATYPICVIAPGYPGAGEGLFSVDDNGDGTWRATIVSNEPPGYGAGTLFVFDEAKNLPTNGTFEVYAPDGNIAFSDKHKYLKMVAANVPTDSYSIYLPPGKRYGGGINKTRFDWGAGNNGLGDWWIYGGNIVWGAYDTTFGAGFTYTKEMPGGSGSLPPGGVDYTTKRASEGFVVDVTGY